MARSATRTHSLEPWMIALIVLATLVALAIVIGLLVYFLVYDQKLFFYQASFRINNVEYSSGLTTPASREFRDLSANIEALIAQAFEATTLKKKLVKSRVVSLSQSYGGVLAEVVLVLKFPASDNKEALWISVNTVLLRRLKLPTWPLSIDLPSYKLSEINAEKGEKLIYSSALLPVCDPLSGGRITHGRNCSCGTRTDRSQERVYGGNIAKEEEWPWQASLQLNGIHRCGATLISDKWLVTAAHCFRGATDIGRWTASFGAQLSPPFMRRKLQQIIVHEDYANNVMNHNFDIAVVKITPPVQFTAAVHHVCLPEATQFFPENTTCYVTGFGALKDDGASVNELRQTEVKIISNEICNRREVYNNAITPGMLCAGYLEGGSDACQGDSGGPLVTEDKPRGIWYLVGIVSWGDECAKRNKPGVYTRVTYYRDWIASKTGI